jgi:hypothetical protein
MLIKEAIGMFLRSIKVRRKGFNEYKGNHKQICKQIIDNCWNNTYFKTSTGHFSAFYIRDFGMCTEALINLGYKEQVLKTLQFALSIYSRKNKLTTTITKDNKPINIFTDSPDTLPFLIHSLKLAKADELIKVYKPFLEKEIMNYFNQFIEVKSGLIYPKYFSSIKDQAKRKTCCYDACMAGMLSNDLNTLNLPNPLKQFDYKEIIKDSYWNGKYFEDTLFENYISGDANVFPYWCGIIDDKKMLKQSIKAIKEKELDYPFPLKYTINRTHKFLFWTKIFSPNYEGTTIWAHLGLCYLDIVAKADKKLLKKYLEMYKEQIEKHKTFLEVYKPNGDIYKTPFYISDEGMLWASKYLYLSKL